MTTITSASKKGASIAKKAGLWALPAVALSVGVPLAQDGAANGGGSFIGQLTIGQRLGYDSDSGTTSDTDDDIFTETTLGLQLTSETRSQRLEFSLDGALRYAFGGGGDNDRFDVEDPRAQLTYALESRRSRLSFDASYQRSDVDDTAFLLDPLDPESDVITGEGNRTRLGLGTTLELGRDGPLSTQLNHFYGETRFSGTTDPSLVDTRTRELGLRLRYALQPGVSLSLFANQRELDAAGPGSSDRETTRAGLGLDYAITPALRAEAELSYSEIDTDDNAGVTSSTSGVNASLSLTRDMPNGSLGFSLSEEQTVNGARRQVRLSRNLDYSRGTFGVTLGLSKTDGLDTEPLIQANATYALDPLSQLSLSLSQSSSVNDDNEESINSQLSIGYSRTLNALSSLSANFTLIDRNALTVTGEDQTSTRFDLSHRYELARGFNMVSSYRRSRTERDGSPDTKTTELFLGLEKTFDFRP